MDNSIPKLILNSNLFLEKSYSENMIINSGNVKLIYIE